MHPGPSPRHASRRAGDRSHVQARSQRHASAGRSWRRSSLTAVGLVLALIAAVVALLATRGPGRSRGAVDGGGADMGLGERLIDLARAKPLLSAGAAVAASL